MYIIIYARDISKIRMFIKYAHTLWSTPIENQKYLHFLQNNIYKELK